MTPATAPAATYQLSRRRFLSGAVVGAAGFASAGATGVPVTALLAASRRPTPATEHDAAVPTAWFDLYRRLVQTTPGYSPPVAARAFGCAGLGLYEALVPGLPGATSLHGTINALPRIETDGANAAYHWPTVANAALADIARSLFPTAAAGTLADLEALEQRFEDGAPLGIRARSVRRGRDVAAAIKDWSASDGGHEGYLRNFPTSYTPPQGPGLWEPTPPGFLRALQPTWGQNRCMGLSSAGSCDPGPHPAFSTDEGSAFFAEAFEVYETVMNLSPEQEAIARFWSDDPGVTATPAGHSISILTQLLRSEDWSLAGAAEAYGRLGVALCDAFISCWRAKYLHNLLRPITYVRAHIDRSWGDPLPLTTPPFPEYPSGHSVQSGAAAEVITALFGVVPFTDHTHDGRGLPSRTFDSMADAAAEAAMSRLYGGIHFRSAIERGLEQGQCVGAAAVALPMYR